MKRFFIFSLIVLSIASIKAYSLPLTDVGFFGGLSTPNDQVGNVYNSSRIGSGEDVYDLSKSAMDNGYHIGMKVRFGLSSKMHLTGGFSWNRFPETSQDVFDPNDNNKQLTTIKTTTNVMPLSAGINYYVVDSFVGLYGIGELTYNFINSTVDFTDLESGVSIPVTREPADSRIGYSLGAGLDFNMQLISVGLEVKYNYLNLIGTESGEPNKDFLSIGLILYL